MCWGWNLYGQVGDGTSENWFAPTQVSGLASGVSSMAATWGRTCAVAAGAVLCWGSNVHGEIVHDSSATSFATPTQISGLGLLSGTRAVAAGRYHSCAITDGGGVMCWGVNTSAGEIGANTATVARFAPTQVSGLTAGVVAIAAGYSHTCVVTSEGGVKCWGSNAVGQIGDNTKGNNRLAPTQVSGLTSGVIEITAGLYHTCALTQAGGLMCWGSNMEYQLGIDDYEVVQKLVPTKVPGLTSGVSAVSAGKYHTCARKWNGEALCWGENAYGKTGDTTSEYYTYAPTPVEGFP